MFNILRIYLLFLLVGLILPLLAQEDGGMPGELLRYGIGGRALGMGRAYTALVDDATATYWNPAGLAENITVYRDKPGFFSRLSLSLSSLTLLANTHFSAISLSYNVNRHLAVGCSYLQLGTSNIEGWELVPGDIPRQTLTEYDFRNHALLFSGAWRVPARLRFNFGYTMDIGLTMKITKNTVTKYDSKWKYRGTDFGFRLRPFSEKFYTSFTWQNIENFFEKKASYEKYPSVYRFGVGWQKNFTHAKRLLLELDYERMNFREPHIKHLHFGAEFQLCSFFALRGGWNRDEWNLGLGFSFLKSSAGSFNFDPAWGIYGKEELPSSYRGGFSWTGRSIVSNDLAKDLYENAKKALSNSDTTRAIYLLNEIRLEYRGSEFEMLAYARLGDIEFARKNFAAALKNYNNFKSELRNFKYLFKNVIFKNKKDQTGKHENELLSYLKLFQNHVQMCQEIVKKDKSKQEQVTNIIQFYKNFLQETSDEYYANYFAAISYFKTVDKIEDSSVKAEYWIKASGELNFLTWDSELYPFLLKPIMPIFRLNEGISVFNAGKALLKEKSTEANKLLDKSKQIFNDLIQNEQQLTVFHDPLLTFINKDSSVADDALYYLGEYYRDTGDIQKAAIQFAKLIYFYSHSAMCDSAKSKILILSKNENLNRVLSNFLTTYSQYHNSENREWFWKYFMAVCHHLQADSLNKTSWNLAANIYDSLISPNQIPDTFKKIEPLIKLNIGICRSHLSDSTAQEIFLDLINHYGSKSIIECPLKVFTSTIRDNAQYHLGKYYLLMNEKQKAFQEFAKINLFFPKSQFIDRIKIIFKNEIGYKNEDLSFRSIKVDTLIVEKVIKDSLNDPWDMEINNNKIYIINNKNSVISSYSLFYPYNNIKNYLDKKDRCFTSIFFYDNELYVNDLIQKNILLIKENNIFLKKLDQINFRSPITIFNRKNLIYILDNEANTLYQFNMSTRQHKSFLVKSILPLSIVVDQDNRTAFIADYGNQQIRKYNLQKDSTIFLPQRSAQWWPISMKLDSSSLYVIYWNLVEGNNDIIEYKLFPEIKPERKIIIKEHIRSIGVNDQNKIYALVYKPNCSVNLFKIKNINITNK